MPTRISAILLLLLATGCSEASKPTPPMTLDMGMSPSQLTSMVSVADATRNNESYGEALLIYQQILVSDAKNAAAQFGIAECLFALGNAKEAKPIFHGLVQTKDYQTLAVQGEGLTELALGQRDRSEPLLHKAVEADPTLWRSWNALGEIADFRHKPDEAMAFYAHALEAKPDSPAIINNIGYSKLLNKQPEEAILEFKKALALDSGSTTIRNNLRLAMAASGNYAEAVQAATRSQTPVVYNNVGYVAMQRGDYSIAQAYLVKAMEGSPSYDSVAAKNLDQLKARQGTSQ